MDQRQIFLRDVLSVVFKRKFLIVFFLIAVFAVVFVGNYAWPPSYESTAKVRLMRGRETSQTNSTVLRTPGESVSMVQMTPEDLNSEIELIYSADVLAKVAAETGLNQGIPTGGGPLQGLFRLASSALDQVQYLLALKARPDENQRAMLALKKAIRVTPIKESHVMEITCRMGDPASAQKILAAVLEAYKAKHIEVFSLPDTITFFQEQSGRVATELATAQAKLEKFRTENKLVSLEAENNLLLEQYTNAKKLLVQLKESESATQTLGEEITDQKTIETLARSTENPVVTELQLRMLELLLERSRMVQSLGPKHPEVLGVSKSIENAQAQLKDAIASTRSFTEQKMADLETRLATLNKLQAQVEELDREVKTKADAQDYYAQKVEESRVSDAMSKGSITNIKVISEPDLPANPVTPRKLLNLVLALFGGLAGGIALAFFLDYLDHGLKTPEDVEHFLKLKPLASFMRAGAAGISQKESARLATMIDVQRGDKPLKLLQVHSAVSGEDSYAVAKGLAESYAGQQEGKVLLVDLADEKSSGSGFTNLAMEGGSPHEFIAAGDKGVFTLGRGTHAECPAFVWKSSDMTRLIDTLRTNYSHVVFHTPPVLQASDALNLSRISDGIIFVIMADKTRREVVERAVDMLSGAGNKVIGAVLTGRTQPIPSAIYKRI
jgi:uncharacterized protein involved in exopolysaccharide biosynthesis